MLPGNDTNWKGRIHSNRDIYVGVESGRFLNLISNCLRSSGAIRRTRKDTTEADPGHYMTGTVRVKRKGVPDSAVVNDANYPTIPARGSVRTPDGNLVPVAAAPNGYDSSFFGYDGNGDGDVLDDSDLAGFAEGSSGRWDGTVATAANGVPELSAPTDISAFRPAAQGETAAYKFDSGTGQFVPASGSDATHVKGYYHENADYVIRNDRIYDSNGVDITSVVSPNPLSQGQVFDGREYNSSEDGATQGRVAVTQIDIAKLNQAVRTDTNAQLFPPGGRGRMIYAYRTDATPRDPRGIRLRNGSFLNSKLTLASENPVYVQGDFNVYDPDDSSKKKGVAILADSLNLLSNQWNDSKTASSELPVPTGTLEINAAVVAGGYESLVGKYNGGFENYPRFHEDWSSAGLNTDPDTNDWIKVRLRGSFISLFESHLARGLWVYGGRCYTAPKRDWDFDTDFLNSDYLPPGFPVSVMASRVVWWAGREMNWWP
jgi:hypothetical protein